MRNFLFCLILLSPRAQADIVGGDEVRPEDRITQSVAALYEPAADGRGGALCTASLIGPHTLITAAHCLSSARAKPVVIFGRDVRATDRELRPSTAVAIHPSWAQKQGRGMDQGDIALVKFRGKLPPGYRAVPFARSDASLRRGRQVTLAGYGISDAQRKTGSGILRKTRVEVVGPRPGQTEMILDQTQGHGACHGDSGGPAFIESGGKIVLAGVTNRGYPPRSPDDCAHRVVYTKVSSYAPWITEASHSMRATRARIARSLPMGKRVLKKLTPLSAKTISLMHQVITGHPHGWGQVFPGSN